MYTFTFNLKRNSKHTLKSGNEIISANDRLHFAVKAQLTKHLRTLAESLANARTRQEPFSPSNPCAVTITVLSCTDKYTLEIAIEKA